VLNCISDYILDISSFIIKKAITGEMANSQRMTGVIVKTNDNAFVSYKEYRWDFDLLKWKFWL